MGDNEHSKNANISEDMIPTLYDTLEKNGQPVVEEISLSETEFQKTFKNVSSSAAPTSINAGARQAFEDAYGEAPKTARALGGTRTIQDIQSVLKTLEHQTTPGNKDTTTYSGRVLHAMATNLEIVLDLRSQDQDAKAAKGFEKIQKTRSEIMASTEIKKPENSHAKEFVKNMLVLGDDGKPETGLEGTFQLLQYVAENPKAKPEEFQTKLNQARATKIPVPVQEREIAPVAETDRTEIIRKINREQAEARGEPVPVEQRRAPKEPLDLSQPPVLTPEMEDAAASFERKLQNRKPDFTPVDGGKVTSNFCEQSNPFITRTKECADEIDKHLTGDSQKWTLEGDEPPEPL